MMDLMDRRTERDLQDLTDSTARQHADLDRVDTERIRADIAEHIALRATTVEWELEPFLRLAGRTGVTVDDVAARWGVPVDAARDALVAAEAGGLTPMERTETGRWRLR